MKVRVILVDETMCASLLNWSKLGLALSRIVRHEIKDDS